MFEALRRAGSAGLAEFVFEKASVTRSAPRPRDSASQLSLRGRALVGVGWPLRLRGLRGGGGGSHFSEGEVYRMTGWGRGE